MVVSVAPFSVTLTVVGCVCGALQRDSDGGVVVSVARFSVTLTVVGCVCGALQCDSDGGGVVSVARFSVTLTVVGLCLARIVELELQVASLKSREECDGRSFELAR